MSESERYKMEYTYPKISNCLIYKKHDMYSVEVTDYFTDEVYLVELEEAKYMKKLDGKTHPYDIETNLTEEEIDCLIAELDNCGLLKESNKIAGGGTAMRTIWEPKWTIKLRIIAFLCNNLLMILWLPVLIIGIIVFKNNWLSIDFEMTWLGNIIGLGFGIVLHEFGHAFAGASYGARVFEMGVLRMYYIIPGAYVILDDKTVKNRLKRVQINAAGVEMNLFLVGVFLILGAIFGNLGGMFLTAAIQNAFLAALNLTLIKGLDGMAIVSELLGIEDIIETATDVIINRGIRNELREYGTSGNATIAACYMVGAFQIALPLLLLLNVLEVVVCFV